MEVGDDGGAYTECGDLGDNNNALQVDVVCPRPLVGSYVRIRASRGDSRHNASRLFLCEVFVIGYQFQSKWLLQNSIAILVKLSSDLPIYYC